MIVYMHIRRGNGDEHGGRQAEMRISAGMQELLKAAEQPGVYALSVRINSRSAG